METEPVLWLKEIAGKLHGHQQWTDAALLVQAIERDGPLVTFDAGMAALAKRESPGRVVLLKQA